MHQNFGQRTTQQSKCTHHTRSMNHVVGIHHYCSARSNATNTRAAVAHRREPPPQGARDLLAPTIQRRRRESRRPVVTASNSQGQGCDHQQDPRDLTDLLRSAAPAAECIRPGSAKHVHLSVCGGRRRTEKLRRLLPPAGQQNSRRSGSSFPEAPARRAQASAASGNLLRTRDSHSALFAVRPRSERSSRRAAGRAARSTRLRCCAAHCRSAWS